MRTPFIILSGSGTGSTTKTTTAIEFVAALAMHETMKDQKIALLGLDENSELSTILGFNINKLEYSTADIFSSDSSRKEKILQKLPKETIGSNNIFVGLSSPKLSLAVAMYKDSDIKTLVKSFIDKYMSDFSFVVIDVPPGHNFLQINGLYASDFIISPCTYDFKPVEALENFLGYIAGVKGENFDNYGVLINAVDYRNPKIVRDSKELLKPYREKNQIFDTEIPTDNEIKYARKERKSIQVYKPNSKSAKAYIELANEFIQLLN